MIDNWPSLGFKCSSCKRIHQLFLFFTLISFWYRDVTFSTLISFYHRNLRIGNHNLKIETERFTIPKTSEDLRICYHCNQNSVENELHILFHCDQYNDLRKTLFIKINDQNTLFTNYIYSHDKVCFLFNNTIHISAG